MPKLPCTPSKPKRTALITSPYFTKIVTSPYFTDASSDCFPLKAEFDAADEKVGEDGFPPYNPYWSALLRAARFQPRLIQEEVAHDWWKVLVAVMLLNVTTGKVAIPVFRELITLWPDPASMAEAPTSLLAELLKPLGLYNIRAQRLVDLSVQYLADPPSLDNPRKSRISGYPPTAISHLPGCGRYALDSFRMFCCPGDEWKCVIPTDKELIKYLRWKWAIVGRREWDPKLGVIGFDDEDYLDSLCDSLSQS